MSDELIHATEGQAHEVGLPSPSALQYMMSVANMLLTSNLLGPDMEPTRETIQALVAAKWEQSAIDKYRDDVIKSNALAKMLIGREMGIEPMSALQDVTIVKGKMFIHYSALIRQMEMKGYTCSWEERSNTRAALKVSKGGQETLFEFTFEDAERAGLAYSHKKDNRETNQYMLRPRVQLTARVASEAYRTTGGRANVYTPEERHEVLEERSTTEEANEADKRRMEQLQAQYAVKLKDKAAETPAPQQAAPVETKPESKPNGKAADNVVTMPKAEPAATAPAATTAAQTDSDVVFEVHYLDRDGKMELMQSENPQKRPETVKMRAAALANQTGGTYFGVRNLNGIREVFYKAEGSPKQTQQAPAADTNPETTAAAPAEAPAAPAPVEESKSNLRARIEAITNDVEKLINNGVADANRVPLRTVVAKVKTFLQGYFGVAKLSDLPKPTPEFTESYAHAFADLEAIARQDANALFSAPESEGKRLRIRAQDLEKHLEQKLHWRGNTANLAFALVRLRGLEVKDFNDFLESRGLDCMQLVDIDSGLRLCLVTRHGGGFVRLCDDRKLSVAKAVALIERKLGKTLENADSAAIDTAVEWAKQHIAEAANANDAPPAPAPPPPPAPAAAEGSDNDNLFGDLP